MKNTYTDEEIQLLRAMMELSPVVRTRVKRLMSSWIERDKIIKNTNNIIPFKKRSKNEY